MINKSIRLTKADVIGLQELITHDPRVEKGQSEALYYSFKDAAANIPDWTVVANTKFEGDSDIEMDPNDYSIVRTFYIEPEDFDVVVHSLKNQLHITKVRISYMTRLCILAARMRLPIERTIAKSGPAKAKAKQVNNGIALIREIAELLESDTEEAKEKIMKITRIVEED